MGPWPLGHMRAQALYSQILRHSRFHNLFQQKTAWYPCLVLGRGYPWFASLDSAQRLQQLLCWTKPSGARSSFSAFVCSDRGPAAVTLLPPLGPAGPPLGPSAILPTCVFAKN